MEREALRPGPMRTPLVAVVDDDPDILELVSVHLKRTGMKVREFADAESFYRSLSGEAPDLVLLDLMLPDADGMELCKFLRRHSRLSSVPVIMLTARADEVDRVLGLEIGADDYITKPFSPKELVARVKAVLRRAEPKTTVEQGVEIGPLGIDLGRHLVTVEGRAVEVTPVEFRILEMPRFEGRMGLLKGEDTSTTCGGTTRSSGAHRRRPHQAPPGEAGQGRAARSRTCAARGISWRHEKLFLCKGIPGVLACNPDAVGDEPPRLLRDLRRPLSPVRSRRT